MGKVAQFPIKDTKVKKWYDTAASFADDINESYAAAWVRKNVPVQFHKVIYANLRSHVKQKEIK